MTDDPPIWATVEQAVMWAERLVDYRRRVSAHQIRRLAKVNGIPTRRKGHRLLYRLADVQEAVLARERERVDRRRVAAVRRLTRLLR